MTMTGMSSQSRHKWKKAEVKQGLIVLDIAVSASSMRNWTSKLHGLGIGSPPFTLPLAHISSAITRHWMTLRAQMGAVCSIRSGIGWWRADWALSWMSSCDRGLCQAGGRRLAGWCSSWDMNPTFHRGPIQAWWQWEEEAWKARQCLQISPSRALQPSHSTPRWVK